MKLHIFALLVSVAVSLTGLLLIVFQTDPYNSLYAMRLLFFSALFVLIWGIVSSVMLYIKYRFGKNKLNENALQNSYLVGFFFSLIALGAIAINIWI